MKGDFELPVEQAVYVPSTTKTSKRIPAKKYKKRITAVEKYLSKKFGGYTAVTSQGGYVTKRGRLVKEPVVKVTSFGTRTAYKKNRAGLTRQVRHWGSEWGQESMGYEREGDLYYLASKKPKATPVVRVFAVKKHGRRFNKARASRRSKPLMSFFNEVSKKKYYQMPKFKIKL